MLQVIFSSTFYVNFKHVVLKFLKLVSIFFQVQCMTEIYLVQFNPENKFNP